MNNLSKKLGPVFEFQEHEVLSEEFEKRFPKTLPEKISRTLEYIRKKARKGKNNSN